jgi:large subunit ribosomal protein L24
MSKWIKKGDRVVVLAGKEKGKSGHVLSRTEDRVLIQGINIRKKHVKRKTKVATGGIVEKEMSIHISNVSICNADEKPLKLKVKFAPDGTKQLVHLDGGNEVVYRKV